MKWIKNSWKIKAKIKTENTGNAQLTRQHLQNEKQLIFRPGSFESHLSGTLRVSNFLVRTRLSSMWKKSLAPGILNYFSFPRCCLVFGMFPTLATFIKDLPKLNLHCTLNMFEVIIFFNWFGKGLNGFCGCGVIIMVFFEKIRTVLWILEG